MDDSAEAYEQNALEFLYGRDRSILGSVTVEKWSGDLPIGAAGIELACGGGFPITRALNKQNIRLWAVDSSPTLVTKFRSRFPHIPVQCEKVQDFDFFNRTYDFAIAIGLVFLLAESDQIELISRVSEVLLPGGRFLLTAPIELGNWIDTNTGIECISLGQTEYEKIFVESGFQVTSTYTDKGLNNYYDLRRTSLATQV